MTKPPFLVYCERTESSYFQGRMGKYIDIVTATELVIRKKSLKHTVLEFRNFTLKNLQNIEPDLVNLLTLLIEIHFIQIL